jgi:error-prone DNA polymerase
VVFLTLDDMTGPVDATFFEDVQGPYAGTVFHTWLLVVRGLLRRTGPRGVSLRATGAWPLTDLWQLRATQGMAAVSDLIAASPMPAADRRGPGSGIVIGEEPGEAATGLPTGDRAGGMGGGTGRRVLVHASGFRQSPYADIVPAGEDPKNVPRKVWHSSPGSSGR